jgi:hypothetical protein
LKPAYLALITFVAFAFILAAALGAIEDNKKTGTSHIAQEQAPDAAEIKTAKSGEPETVSQTPEFEAQCENGLEQKCTLGNECEEGLKCALESACEGMQKCSDGRWGSCILKKECRAGQEALCTIDECKFGIRICNKCSKWGECVEKSGATNCPDNADVADAT